MLIYFEEYLRPEQVRILEANCWKISFFKDDPAIKPRLDADGTWMGGFIASRAEKEFDRPQDAMFEVESLLEIDVIDDKDHDGCDIHFFRWKNPHWNGWKYTFGEDYSTDPDSSEYVGASGWDCATYMYGAPKTARETAIELQRLRSIFK